MAVLLLCRHCLNWEDPSGSRCPSCGSSLRESEPDLPRAEILERIGPLRDWSLPLISLHPIRGARGRLHATTGGLLFLPDAIWADPTDAEDIDAGGSNPADRLMQHPATFFLPTRSARSVRLSWRRLTVFCRDRRASAFRCLSEPRRVARMVRDALGLGS